MKTKVLYLFLAVLVSVLLSGSVSATPYTWEDELIFDKYMNAGDKLVFTHDISLSSQEDPFVPLKDFAFKYTMLLTLSDDQLCDGWELGFFNQPGFTSDGIVHVGENTFSTSGLGFISLNLTGKLTASVQVKKGDLVLESSRLWVKGIKAAPVPEPATMLLFGFGLLGISGVTRKQTA